MIEDKQIAEFILSLLPMIEDAATLQEIIVACRLHQLDLDDQAAKLKEGN